MQTVVKDIKELIRPSHFCKWKKNFNSTVKLRGEYSEEVIIIIIIQV